MTNILGFVAGQSLRFRYVNHRGETSVRDVRPVMLRWGTSDYYTTPQWLLKALDHSKGAFREFALDKMEALGVDVEQQAQMPLLSVVKD